MNNVNWSVANGQAVILPPGETAGEGRCQAREWGLLVEDVVVYGAVSRLRGWAQSVLDQLPRERGDVPLVVVDRELQSRWLRESGVLIAAEDKRLGRGWRLRVGWGWCIYVGRRGVRVFRTSDWTATVESVRDLMQAVAVDPATAGWTLGDDVAALWADLDDDNGDLDAGVQLAGTGHYVGIGEPLADADLAVRSRTSSVEWANACLTVVADRINGSY